MNATHLHLITNHIPILGLLFSALALSWGMYRKSNSTLLLAFAMIFISSVGGFITGNTGEAAEEALEAISGISHEAIHEHEEAAEQAMPFIITSGILSLVAALLWLKKLPYSRLTQWILLGAVVAACSLSARAGWQGGKIRHAQEINAEVTPAGPEEEHED